MGMLQPGADLMPLLQLPAICLKLGIGGAAFTDAAAAVVGRITQLTALHWIGACQLSLVGLGQLTALQGLRMLVVEGRQ